MSFTFSIAAPEPPDYQTILDGLDLPDLDCKEGDSDEAGLWPEGIKHFWREGVSTRGVEIAFEEGTFGVRILTLASWDDYELALRFVESAAVLLQSPVEPEDGDPFPVDELRQRYDLEWCRRQNDAGVAALRAVIADADQSAILSGPHRRFHIGPMLLAELEEGGPEDEFLDRLIGKMLDVQNVDGDEYYFANVMEAKKNDDDDKGFSFAVWGPGVSYLLPDVEYLALVSGENDPPVFIRNVNLVDVIRDGWDWLDEKQVLVEALDEDEWAAVVERARGFEVNPFEAD